MPFRAKTLQITWHAKQGSKNDPLLSIDFHPTINLFATAGADNEIKVWRLHESKAGGEAAARVDPTVEYLYTLTGHMKTVNTVRFSPNGECLASVSDGAWRSRQAQAGRQAGRLAAGWPRPTQLPSLTSHTHPPLPPQTPCAPSGAQPMACPGAW